MAERLAVITHTGGADMDMRIEVVFMPVTDVDRAKEFYAERMGFEADHDQRVHEGLRFVQMTPPGSACSIAFGDGITDASPGSGRVMMVVADADAARADLLARGADASEVDEQEWGRFVNVTDPDGNQWTLQQLPSWAAGAR